MLSLDAFAEKHGLTRDTVYFYIKEGILSPRKKGQYIFEEDSEEVIRLLRFMKEIGLSMDAIKKAAIARRILGISHPILRNYLTKCYRERENALKAEEEEWNALTL
jgi:DNA-binding transcriptional MerR regulator